MSCSRMEMRQKRKEKKEAIHKIKVEKIKQDVEASMEGSDKKAIEKAVSKELRQKRKEKKEAIHKIEAEKIRQDVEASMKGSDKKAIEEAVRKAVSKRAIKRAKKAQVQHLITKTLINCFINMVSGSS